MAWEGYIEFSGNEVVNVARTEAYAASAGLTWFKPLYKNPYVAAVLNDSTYTNPVTDDAPWVSANALESAEFYGFYPLDITGISDSTLSTNALEKIGDGAVLTLPRSASKEVVFNLALVAGTDAAADYGLQWLKSVLSDACSGTSTGGTLCYFSSEPQVGTWNTCVTHQPVSSSPTVVTQSLLRALRKVRITVGPTEVSKARTVTGGAVRVVTFTVRAGAPFEFSAETPVLAGWLNPSVTNPWPGGVTPTGGIVVGAPYTKVDTPCPTYSYQPVYDPLYPAISPPPTPPGIEWGNFNPPTTWSRRRAVIPASFVPTWGLVSPIVRLNAYDEMRNVRIRFFADVSGSGNVDEECDRCVDFVASFIPEGSTLVFDASDQVVYVESAGGVKRRADSIVFASDGSPFEWPELTCGMPYIMTIDVPVGSVAPYVTLALVGRSA